jgi:hypothetical protein
MELYQLREMLIAGLKQEEYTLPATPPLEDVPSGPTECPILQEWRRLCIPEWREILRTSRQEGDKEREEYAHWMLHDILLDPEYQGSDA